jgi:hypothetical protein
MMGQADKGQPEACQAEYGKGSWQGAKGIIARLPTTLAELEK